MSLHTVEEESLQELRRAARRLYLDAPDPPVHTTMIVARARLRPPKAGAREDGDEDGGGGDGTAESGSKGGLDRVIGTGADRRLTKV